MGDRASGFSIRAFTLHISNIGSVCLNCYNLQVCKKNHFISILQISSKYLGTKKNLLNNNKCQNPSPREGWVREIGRRDKLLLCIAE